MFTTALLAAVLSAPVPKPPPELVVNGSFEDGPDVDDITTLKVGSKKLRGWEVTRGNIDYVTGGWQAADGHGSVDLHGSPGLGGVKQTLAVTKGRTYTVTFKMAGSGWGNPPKKSLWVAAAGAKGKFTFDATGRTKEDMGWEGMSWEFTADADAVDLEFYTAEEADENNGPALDAVSVKEKR